MSVLRIAGVLRAAVEATLQWTKSDPSRGTVTASMLWFIRGFLNKKNQLFGVCMQYHSRD